MLSEAKHLIPRYCRVLRFEGMELIGTISAAYFLFPIILLL